MENSRNYAKANVRTIDVQAKEWFDKVNDNNYFSAVVTINYQMEDGETIILPFQYGYGDYYIQMVAETLNQRGIITIDVHQSLWSYCHDNNIILRTNKQENCKKRELIQ